MPFLGQDWRSPGEQWVKTEEGWEKMKMWRLRLFENLNENRLARFIRLASIEDIEHFKEMEGGTPQPHVFIIKNTTREKKMQTTIAEAFNRLEMGRASRDIRRFNYVSKLLEELIRNKLSQLSGSAQKVVFNVLEQALNHVIKTQNNIRVIELLLEDTKSALKRGHYDHVGCSSLWARHLHLVNKMRNTLSQTQLKEREDDGGMKLTDLPDECVREILVRLSDHRDLVNAGLTETRTCDLAEDTNLWKNLCFYHFRVEQLNAVIRKGENIDTIGWKKLYSRLVKRYGMRNVFTDMLHLCRHCNALFWELRGHPCVVSSQSPTSIPITPTMFIKLFTV